MSTSTQREMRIQGLYSYLLKEIDGLLQEAYDEGFEDGKVEGKAEAEEEAA